MTILLLGSGGREHTLAWKISQSPMCSQLFIAPGNTGTAAHGQNIDLDPLDFAATGDFCIRERVDMLVVGPEEPLVRGIRNYFESEKSLRHIAVIGPGAEGARLEGSKAWAKQFMHRHSIPTAAYREFHSGEVDEAVTYLHSQSLPIVLKADGLAAGKGVVISHDYSEAEQELREMLGGRFGDASSKVVIEQFLSGIEFSVFVLTDGQRYVLLPEAKDYKRIGEGDTGPNTGGMGAVSPVPFFTDELREKVVQRIINPTIQGLTAENIPYTGFIFFGLIRVGDDPYVIEYNCRMGDPETEVVMPRLKSDLLELMSAASRGALETVQVAFEERFATTVVLVSGGYPGHYEKGKQVHGLEHLPPGALLFHAGAKSAEGGVSTSGGRVFAATSYGNTLEEALAGSYRTAELVNYEGKYFRRDIGKDLNANTLYEG